MKTVFPFYNSHIACSARPGRPPKRVGFTSYCGVRSPILPPGLMPPWGAAGGGPPVDLQVLNPFAAFGAVAAGMGCGVGAPGGMEAMPGLGLGLGLGGTLGFDVAEAAARAQLALSHAAGQQQQVGEATASGAGAGMGAGEQAPASPVLAWLSQLLAAQQQHYLMLGGAGAAAAAAGAQWAQAQAQAQAQQQQQQQKLAQVRVV